jgi:cytochrome oxidase assembly protein ShyY1
VLSFYFSYVADAINRSLGLIVLGVVFLAGGWQLERLRRKLMRRIEGAAI